MEKPVEFEIRDYDTISNDSPQPRIIPETPDENQTPDLEAPTQEPQERQEPVEKAPEQQTTKLPRILRNLETGLDGKKWECTETHRPRLRIRTTGVQEEDEYQDSWDNTIPTEDKKTTEED